MSIEQMRAELAKSYPGDKWANKVKNMPEKQVAATYYRLMNAREGRRINAPQPK